MVPCLHGRGAQQETLLGVRVREALVWQAEAAQQRRDMENQGVPTMPVPEEQHSPVDSLPGPTEPSVELLPQIRASPQSVVDVAPKRQKGQHPDRPALFGRRDYSTSFDCFTLNREHCWLALLLG